MCQSFPATSASAFGSSLDAAAGFDLAAHGLKERLGPDLLAVFEVGVRYQMYHALALLALGALSPMLSGRLPVIAGWAFTIGIIIFSGSLYALTLSGVRVLGAITPIGGVAENQDLSPRGRKSTLLRDFRQEGD